MFKTKKQKNKKGFTLIEVIVSVGLFAVVVTITLSSILTISDSNKKSRSLMSVMTNLNFAIESITRSFRTGTLYDGSNRISNPVSSNSSCLTTYEIDYAEVAEMSGAGDFQNRKVEYCFIEVDSDGNKIGKIQKKIDKGLPVDLTSPDVDIDYLKFTSSGSSVNNQPIVNIALEGTVKISEKIKSNFSIQTSVSQRKLNI